MGLFGTSVHELESRIVELRKKVNNLPQKLYTLKKTNKSVWEEVDKEARSINKASGKIIMRGILGPNDIERVSRVAQEVSAVLRRLKE